MRLLFTTFTLFAALVGTSAAATAQEMEGRYESTNLDGSKIAEGYTIYIEVTYQHTDENGIEHYTTQSTIVEDASGEVVQTGTPGSLEWGPGTGFGDLIGSSGIDGYLYDDPGTGSFVADYSNAGGNIRLWTPSL